MREPFIWGSGGRQLTPDEVERLRAASASAAMRGADASPVGSVAGGLARLVDAWGGYRGNMRADEQAASGRQSAQDVVSALLGNTMSGMSSPGFVPQQEAQPTLDQTTGMVAPANPQVAGAFSSDPAAYIRQGLIDRGMPAHAADAFVMNFQDESGLNPGINEANPLVAGSRGGFGLGQWTGPRRVALEQYAQGRGASVADPDTQLDYLMTELQGPESRAAAAIYGAPDAGQAAAAAVNQFFRPAQEHRERRSASYLGGAAPSPAAMGGGSMPSVVGQGGISPVTALLAQAQSNPWVAQEYGGVIGALMQQDMARQNATMQQQMQRDNAIWEMQQKQQDPMYQTQLRTAQAQLDQMLNPAAPAPVQINGQLVNPQTGEVIGDYRDPSGGVGALSAEGQTLLYRAREAGLEPGTPEYQQFMLSGGRVTNTTPAAQAAREAQALAAGLEPGTPDYQDFMLTGGAGQRAAATAAGTARGNAQAGLVGTAEKAQRAIDNLNAIRNDPALASITGMFQGRLPPVTQAGTDLNTRIQQAQGQAFLEAFESLKGGGAITEVEGTKAEQAMARLNRAQSTEAYQAALDELVSVLDAGVSRAYERAGQSRPSAAAPASSSNASAPQRRRFNPQTGGFE